MHSFAPQLPIGSATVTANLQGAFVVDGQTLTAGDSAIMVSGTRVSLDFPFAVIDSSTTSLQSGVMTRAPLVIGGISVTPDAHGSGRSRLTAGIFTSIAGELSSIAANGQSDVVRSSTEDLGSLRAPITVSAGGGSNGHASSTIMAAM